MTLAIGTGSCNPRRREPAWRITGEKLLKRAIMKMRNKARPSEASGGKMQGLSGEPIPKISVYHITGPNPLKYVVIPRCILPKSAQFLTVNRAVELLLLPANLPDDLVERNMILEERLDEALEEDPMESFMGKIRHDVEGIQGLYKKSLFFATSYAIWSGRSLFDKPVKTGHLDLDPECKIFFQNSTTVKGLSPDIVPFKPFAKPLVVVAGGRIERGKHGECHCQAVVFYQLEGRPIAYIQDSREDAKCRERLFELLQKLGIKRAIVFPKKLSSQEAPRISFKEAIKKSFGVVADILNGSAEGKFWENERDPTKLKLYSSSSRKSIRNWNWNSIFDDSNQQS